MDITKKRQAAARLLAQEQYLGEQYALEMAEEAVFNMDDFAVLDYLDRMARRCA